MGALVDHVVLVVPDLHDAARVIRELLGRGVLDGGRDEEAGTASMLVPLLNSTLEFVTVFDAEKAAAHPFGRRVARCLETQTLLAAWAIDVDATTNGSAGAPPHDADGVGRTRGDGRFVIQGFTEDGVHDDRPLSVRRVSGKGASIAASGELRAVHVATPDDSPPWPAVPDGSTVFTVADSSAVRGAILHLDVDDLEGSPVRVDERSWRTAREALAEEEEAAERLDRIRADRRNLHRIPEVGLHLPLTQRYIVEELERIGLTPRLGESLSSVTAVLEGRTGAVGARKAVLLRSDMDALPMREATGLSFASNNGAMHACGHDLHMAMLLEAARALAARKDALVGDVVFAFQPGEENHGGARRMLEEGLYETQGREIVASFGLHVLSYLLDFGTVALRRGAIMAGSTIVEVVFVGKGGHGSAPHRARDPLAAGASFVTAVTSALAHAIDMFEPNVLTFGSFHSGSSTNVIPDEATLRGTLRTFTPETTVTARSVIERVAHATADAHDVDAVVTLQEICLPVVNDDDEVGIVVDAAGDAGIDVTWLERPISVSEDFSYMLEANRGAFVLLGAVIPEADPQKSEANHSARADFDEEILTIGADLLASWAVRRLATDG